MLTAQDEVVTAQAEVSRKGAKTQRAETEDTFPHRRKGTDVTKKHADILSLASLRLCGNLFRLSGKVPLLCAHSLRQTVYDSLNPILDQLDVEVY